MDRHKQKHRAARVELPASIRFARGWDLSEATTAFRSDPKSRKPPTRLEAVLGLVGFVGTGIAVVATASLLALYVS